MQPSPAAPDRAWQGRPAPGKRRAAAEGATLRILIAEDDRDSADSLKMLLEACGYAVRIEHDGESAVRTAVALRPHVIIMDIGLPELNGYDAVRRIRAESPDRSTRIIALTGLDRQIDRLRSAEAGIDHHMVKPLDLAVLQRILDSAWVPGAH